MLQFIARSNDRYSIPEQAQMAIEGGCKWVIMRVPDLADEEIRELAAEMIPLCKENGTILTIENHVELAKELGIHGVHLRGASVGAREAREICGPEAIIGVGVATPSQALALKGADADYVAFRTGADTEAFAASVATLRGDNFELPIVAELEDGASAEDAVKAGASGVAVGQTIGDAADPVAATEAVLAALAK